MKKLVFIIIGGMLILSGASVLGVTNSNDHTTISFHATFAEPVLNEMMVDTNTFVTISMEGTLGTTHHVGAPVLPVQIKNFELPFGTKIGTVSYQVDGVSEVSLPVSYTHLRAHET